MKTFVFDNNHIAANKHGIISWYFLADSSLTNAGKPFFIPDFAEIFEAIPVIAVRINRLGKSISPKFAHRYYTEYAPAIHFRAKDLLKKLKELHLSSDPAASFDRSLIMSEFLPFPKDGNISLKMTKNGEAIRNFASQEMTLALDEVISQASVANTLKMGDLIIPALTDGTEVAIGDMLELTTNGDVALSVQIK